MNQSKKVCVVVPVRNRLELTKRFLECFTKSEYKNFKIVIVDDGSTDGTSDFISSNYPDVELIVGNGSLWWAGATNLGVKYALINDFDYVLTINDDAQVDKYYLSKLVDCALNNPNTIVGSLIYRSDNGNIWAAGSYIKWNSTQAINLGYTDLPQNEFINSIQDKKTLQVQMLTGDGTLFPIDVFRKCGLYNTFFTPQYHADSEMVLRADKKGYRAVVCVDAKLVNEINHISRIKNKFEIIFSKKSDYYLPSLFFLFFRYAPLKYKLGFLFQYYRFFPNFIFYRLVKGLRC